MFTPISVIFAGQNQWRNWRFDPGRKSIAEGGPVGITLKKRQIMKKWYVVVQNWRFVKRIWQIKWTD